jgi:hypothetical protein
VNTATGPADQGNQIITSSCNTFNYIGDPNVPDDIIAGSGGVYGILATGQNNFVVRNCIIQNITGTASIGAIDGIYVTNSFGSIEVSNNIIRSLRRSSSGLSSTQYVNGIRINWDNQLMHFKIFNNSISNLLSSYIGAPTSVPAVIGIYFDDAGPGSVSTEIYNNSISINGSTFPNASSACISIASTTKSFQIKNNIFSNYTSGQTAPANHGCFYTNAANQYGGFGSLSDYNCFYLADTANGYIGRATSTSYQTLASWQAAMTMNAGTDANSLVANPNFVNAISDLHLTSASAALNGAGTTPPGFAGLDIDCEPRNAPHDIGFDDYTDNAIMLKLSFIIEGYHSGNGIMNSVLFNAGEDVHPDIADSMIVEIRDAANPEIIVANKTVLVKTNGEAIVYLPLFISGGNYYISVRGRNSVETWSKIPVTFAAITNYDFK